MKKNIFWAILLALFISPFFNSKIIQASAPVDSLIKGSGSAVYYYTSDGDRYVFPNSKTFSSWFVDFSNIITITDEEMAQIPLKGNVTYRPGIRMIKITTNPEVYAVSKGGVLRSLKTEAMAEQLYGADWNKKIDDVPDSFFTNYTIGDPIESAQDYIPLDVSSQATTINQDKNIAESTSAIKANTVFSGPEAVEIPAETNATSTLEQVDNSLTIAFGEAIAQETSVTITWTTNKAADEKILYSQNSTLSTSATSFNSTKALEHSITLRNLISNTTYYYTITSSDDSGNNIATDIMSFTTLQLSTAVDPFVVGYVSDSSLLDGVTSTYISGDYAYLAAQNNNTLAIVDVSTPASPAIIGSIKDDSYLGGISDIYVSGNYVYTLSYNNNYLVILDISNPAAPAIIGSVRDNEKLYTPSSVYVSGNYAYVTSFFGSRLTIVNISDKERPSISGSVYDAIKLEGADSVKIDGDFAYTTSKNNDRLTVVDISNPSSPVIAGSIASENYLDGISAIDIAGGLVFAVMRDDDRLTVVDASNPNDITIASSKQDTTYLNDVSSISISGNYAYVTTVQNNYFTIINIGNPFLTPSVTKSIKSENFYGADSIFVFNNYAYLGSASADTLIIVDISKYAAGSVLGIKIKSNPMELKADSLVKDNRLDKIFYVNKDFCLQWVPNDKIARKYFGDNWGINIPTFSDVGGYDYCEYLE